MTREELAAVLTGLRILQYELEKHGEPPAQFAEIFTDCDDLTPLTADQIDELCMQINTKRNDEEA